MRNHSIEIDRRLTSPQPCGRMRRLMLVLAGLATVLPMSPRLAGAAPLTLPAPVIEPSRRADTVVVTYREVISEIGDVNRGPTLRVYGDGRMVAHYPRYMKKAGDYEQRLAPGELDQLLGSLASKGLFGFDTAATRNAVLAAATAARQRTRIAPASVALFEAVDAATTVIEVHVDRYRASTPGAREARNLTKRVAWTGLRVDAEHHADIPALRDLAAAEQELRALRERPGFTRVR